MGTHFYQAFVQKVVVASLWRSAVRRDSALVGEKYRSGSYVERKTRCDRSQKCIKCALLNQRIKCPNVHTRVKMP